MRDGTWYSRPLGSTCRRTYTTPTRDGKEYDGGIGLREGK